MKLKNGFMAILRWEGNAEGKIGGIHSTLHSWWKMEVAYPLVKLDNYLRHIVREHNQEAHHVANLGTEGKAKITFEGVGKTEKWKAVRVYWMEGSTQDDRSSR